MCQRVRGEASTRASKAGGVYLGYRRHGELEGEAGGGVIVQVVIVVGDVRLALEGSRAAVAGHEGVHHGGRAADDIGGSGRWDALPGRRRWEMDAGGMRRGVGASRLSRSRCGEGVVKSWSGTDVDTDGGACRRASSSW